MYDDYDVILNSFKHVKGVEIKEDADIEGNPILVITLGNIRMKFYFNVEAYEDKAYFCDLIVEEIK